MRRLGLIAAAIAGLTLASWIDVPMVPVPMTLQSLAVLLVGAYGGARAGLGAVLAWLALAAAGAPVLSGMEGGSAKFIGPTAGYLAAFPLAALASGAAADRGLLARPIPAMGVMLTGHTLMLGLGFAWLQTSVGPSAAWQIGVAPFLLGMGVKSALAVVLRPRGSATPPRRTPSKSTPEPPTAS